MTIDHLFILLFGACVGSFLNVCIYRIPAGRSVSYPGSTCACGRRIAWRDNIPILSWVLLGGRARCCGGHFSIRYPAIELLTALLFLAISLSLPWWQAVTAMVFVSLAVCATFIDIDHMVIPDGITIGGAMVGLVLVTLMPAVGLGLTRDVPYLLTCFGNSLVSGLVASGMLFWLAATAEWLLNKEAMGMGDVKFIGTIGVFLGWKGAVFSLFGGAMVGLAWLVASMVMQKIFSGQKALGLKHERDDGSDSVGLGSRLSFGPMLAAGAVFYLLIAHRWADPLLDAYVRR